MPEKKDSNSEDKASRTPDAVPADPVIAVFNELAEEFWPDALRAAFTGNGGLERCGRRSCKLAGSCQMIYTSRQAARLRRRRTGGCGYEGCVRRCRRLQNDQSYPSGHRNGRPSGHRESRPPGHCEGRLRLWAPRAGWPDAMADRLPAKPFAGWPVEATKGETAYANERRRQTAIFMPGSCSMVQA
jgi:hypothetical protein